MQQVQRAAVAGAHRHGEFVTVHIHGADEALHNHHAALRPPTLDLEALSDVWDATGAGSAV